jgi:predicted alpha/beta-hydrolase family hydrolase
MPTVSTPAGAVSYVVDGESSGTTVVLAPGAGAGMRHEFMQFFAEGLAGRGLSVVRFDFAYMEKGRRSPDRQPVLEETYRAVVHELRADLEPARLVLGGKSMGGRIASHVVAAGEAADGLVFLGYPLHPPGKPERLRDAHLYDIEVPMLFVEGTRDPFCPLTTLEHVRKKITAATEVYVVEDGDHSLKVRKSSGRSTEQAWRDAIDAIADWLGARGAD